MPALAAILQRFRSFSLSIGQLTFGSFLLLLAVITATSMASVIAMRHLDSTFAELQRLQDVGDLAEEIDRRLNELRLAARDFVTDPTSRPERVGLAASELTAALKKTRLGLAPEQQKLIDGVSQRLANYSAGIARVSGLISHRAELLGALPPARPQPGPSALPCAQSDHFGVVGARSDRGRTIGRADARVVDRRSGDA
jgi:hypothetical protein